MNTNDGIAKLGKIPVDTLASLQVADSGGLAKTRHRHDGSRDIDSSQSDCPLHGSDE